MNIKQLILIFLLSITAYASDKPDYSSMFAESTFKLSNGEILKYRLLSPAKINKGKKYPLVIFFHGAGERGDDNKRQLRHFVKKFAEYQQKYPCYVIAAQCPKSTLWANVKWGKKNYDKLPEEPSESMASVMELLKKFSQENPVDTKRIYAVGLSMGGYGVWDILCREPDLFAAAIPICGGGDNSLADTISHIPVWVWHGDSDNIVPVIRSRGMVEALKKAGGKPKYTELEGVKHLSWGHAARSSDLFEWLFNQHK